MQDLATQWIQAYPCKTKTSQETQRSLQKFLSPIGSRKSFTLTIPWNSAKLVKISPGIIARLHHTDRRLMGLLNESWWADSMECYTYLRNVKDVLGNHLKDLLFHLVHWLNITLLLRRICPESINLERKFYLDSSSDTLCTRGDFGGVTY